MHMLYSHPTQEKIVDILIAKTLESVRDLRNFIDLSLTYQPSLLLFTISTFVMLGDNKRILTNDQVLVHYDPEKLDVCAAWQNINMTPHSLFILWPGTEKPSQRLTSPFRFL